MTQPKEVLYKLEKQNARKVRISALEEMLCSVGLALNETHLPCISILKGLRSTEQR